MSICYFGMYDYFMCNFVYCISTLWTCLFDRGERLVLPQWSVNGMGKMKDRYIELHTLEWDIQNSPCGECPYVNDCQYYYGKCPQGGD